MVEGDGKSVPCDHSLLGELPVTTERRDERKADRKKRRNDSTMPGLLLTFPPY